MDGFILSKAIRASSAGGAQVTARLQDLILKRARPSARALTPETMRAIKERLCYVAVDRAQEAKVTRQRWGSRCVCNCVRASACTAAPHQC